MDNDFFPISTNLSADVLCLMLKGRYTLGKINANETYNLFFDNIKTFWKSFHFEVMWFWKLMCKIPPPKNKKVYIYIFNKLCIPTMGYSSCVDIVAKDDLQQLSVACYKSVSILTYTLSNYQMCPVPLRLIQS